MRKPHCFCFLAVQPIAQWQTDLFFIWTVFTGRDLIFTSSACSEAGET